ncbi:cystine transporter permease [Siminovitchia terrae]|uniref:Amino acid ABC transporter permease n=2 Tax=Siminovitchia terrae TaxID=1914933 RepID=A0A429X6D8_SIMTE|nr:amino acid ABC transporter permease [Siminovitchia terrae]GIN89314.1 cystine transporter permease [Siminovitchia terrae]GIN95378.1 cystine transporter permease [Siminovitchia terrae]
MSFWDLLIQTIPGYMDAVKATVQITLVGLIIGLLIGLFFAFLKVSNIKILSIIADIYIYIIRGTPLIVQIFILYFGLVEVVDLGRLWAGGIALGVHNGAYIAEIFRGSIQSIDKGQTEAARSLGMPSWLAMRRVVLPQAFRRAIPPLGNQLIIALKDSSLVALIGFQDLFNRAQRLTSSTGMAMENYIIVGIYYLVLVLILTFLVNRLEHRLSKSERGAIS